MPPVKNCPYCEYTTSSTHCFNPHVFKNHKDELLAALTVKYSQYKIPIAPFTLAVPKYSKEWIVCLCCNEIWTSRGPYDKHIVSSKGACVPANQLVALQTTTGLKFSDKAMEQTATTALQKQQAEAIEKLQAIIAKQNEVISAMKNDIHNLKTSMYITKPWLKGAQPQPTPQPPPKPTIKPAPPVVYDDDEDDEEEYSSAEELLPTKPELRCIHSASCGDTASSRDFDLLNCKKCRVAVCRTCVRKTGATSLTPYCSARCRVI